MISVNGLGLRRTLFGVWGRAFQSQCLCTIKPLKPWTPKFCLEVRLTYNSNETVAVSKLSADPRGGHDLGNLQLGYAYPESRRISSQELNHSLNRTWRVDRLGK